MTESQTADMAAVADAVSDDHSKWTIQHVCQWVKDNFSDAIAKKFEGK